MGPGYRHVACCIDDSDASDPVLREGMRLVEDDADAVLSLVHAVAVPVAVMAVPAPDMAEIATGTRRWLDERGGQVVHALRDRGSQARVQVVVLEGHAGVAVTDWAGRSGVDLIVAGSHRGLVDRALLGSFASYVAYHSPCAVHLVRPAEGSASQG